MFKASTLFVFTLLAVVHGQQVGTLLAETHPPLSIQECTAPGSCTTQEKSIVLDSNWRWLHSTEDATNCYDGNAWDATLCPDPATCSENCAVDGAAYTETYGLKTSESALSITFVTRGEFSTNIGSRVYLMEDETSYKMFNLKNQEFTFDVDMSQLPCGLNGALYFVQMDEDGGLSKYPTNKAGAKYGTGYCDTQCPHDIKFINGLANVESWNPSPDDPNAGTGKYGTCCNEMDIWEANSMAAALTPHVCSGGGGQTQCSEGTECGDGDARDDGICDKDGCDFNSYRQGDPSFLGVDKTVDTSKLITVVTQFITADNTTAGALTEIRRIYVQDGQVIQNSKTAVEGMEPYDSITDEYCAAQKTAFGDTNSFATRGGMAAMGDAFEAGMVLVMSIWDDHAAKMLWLDGPYPPDKDPSAPGVTRGACSADSGKPEEVEVDSPGATVIFSNIKYGAIGSTYAT